jgi:hypothetical protein
MPQVLALGGPVLATPRFVPILYSGDDHQSDITAFMPLVGVSSYWTSIAPQYGVGTASSVQPVVLTDTAPTTLTDAQIQTWLQGELDGTHPNLGTADPSSVYVIFYPATTTINTPWATSCALGGFDGYHSQTAVGTTPVVYAVIARCNDSFPLTALVSHELFEATTDPLFYTSPAYIGLDDLYADTGLTNEIGDLCEGAGTLVPSDIGFPVQRIWSNAASAGGHQPCAPSNALFFDTVADVPETLTDGNGKVPGITIPVGESRTIQLVAFSDAPTQGPWTVSAQSSITDDVKLGLSLCRTSAQNGESIPLTITQPLAATQPSTVTITSVLGSTTMTSSFLVGL